MGDQPRLPKAPGSTLREVVGCLDRLGGALMLIGSGLVCAGLLAAALAAFVRSFA